MTIVHKSPWTPQITREIHALSQKYLRSIRGEGRDLIQPEPQEEQRFEDFMLRFGAGRRTTRLAAPMRADDLRPIPPEEIEGIPEDMRDLYQDVALGPPGTLRPIRRRSLDQVVRNYTDAEILETVAWNVRWIGADAVVDRIVSHVRAIASGDKVAGRAGRAFLKGLMRAATPTKAKHRGKYHDDRKVTVVFLHFVDEAEQIRERYLAVRTANPDWTVLELGREMMRAEETFDGKRPDDVAVKKFLAEMCAVVPARDSSRPHPRLLTIEHNGWPKAATYSLLSKTLELSTPTIRRAVSAH